MTTKCVLFLIATLVSVVGFTRADAETSRIINTETSKTLSTKSMRNAIPNNSPCKDQPKSYKELKQLFEKGRVPSVTEMNGTWVAIGYYGEDTPSVNCSGVKRGNVLESVLTASQYSIEIDMIGTYLQKTKMVRNKIGELTFSPDLGGDNTYVYRCRLSSRKTLICLGSYDNIEFKQMRIKDYQRASKSSLRNEQ